MKKISLFLSLVFFALSAFAQGNLQFNRVFFVESSFTIATTNSFEKTDISFTVPAGKVWKLESAHGTFENTGSTNPSYIPAVQVMINKKLVHFYSSSSPTDVGGYLPMWLPEGTYTLTLSMSNSGNIGNRVYGGITGIEFNIIP
jgi:hypothetical protein